MCAILTEVNVPVRDDSHKATAQFAVLRDGESSEAVALLRLEYVPNLDKEREKR